jgi:hypothetical protein
MMLTTSRQRACRSRAEAWRELKLPAFDWKPGTREHASRSLLPD